MDDSIHTITSNIVNYAGSIGAEVVRNTDEGVSQIPDSEVISHQIIVELPSKVSEIACPPKGGVEEKPLETRLTQKADKIPQFTGNFQS
ncbi:MAG: hypothetical protein LBF25_00100 [Puniceicoccales bacterium]|jgi:hypothetical protein|nr:hypothetical protein [Puniceicoccales bacterium]